MAERVYLLFLAYDGTNYCGWQFQKNALSIQQVVEEALGRLTGRPVRLTASGRTDAGVHALGQVAAFHTDTRLTPSNLAKGLNSILPRDIRILGAREADPGFHPQFQAQAKQYRYHLWLGGDPPLFVREYLWAVRKPLDQAAVRAGLEVLLGRHDFAAFRSTGSEAKETVRTMFRAELIASGRLWTLVFEADGFLRHMVRGLAGTLIRETDPATVARILESRDRALAGINAPARGLFLAWVRYAELGEPVTSPGPFDPLG